MDLYKEYIKERENAELEHNEKGFMSYKVENNMVVILDAYTKPLYRKHNTAKTLLDNIIQKTKVEKVFTTTDSNANGWETAEKVILSLGFKKQITVGNVNYYVKRIKEID